MAFDLSTARPVVEPKKSGFDLSTARPVDDSAQQSAQPQSDSLLKNTKDVTAEVAAGANSTMMAIPDAAIDAVNLVIGGIKGVGRMGQEVMKYAVAGQSPDFESALPKAVADTQARPIPNASDVVEMATGYRPGDGGYMEPGMARDATRAFGQVAVPGAMALTPVQGRNLASVEGAVSEIMGFGSAPSAVTRNALINTIDDSPPIRAKGPDPSLPNNFPMQVVNDAPPPVRTPGGSIGVGRRAERAVARDAAIKRGEGSPIAAGFRLDDAGNVVKCPRG
jgi:hypothetical protein